MHTFFRRCDGAAAISGAGMAACIVFGVFVVLGVILVLTVNQRVDYTDKDFTYRDMLRITHRYEYSQVKKIRYGCCLPRKTQKVGNDGISRN